jgi:hypothetical protein
MWVGRDGEDLLFSTVEGRVKHRNMQRDPRVSGGLHEPLCFVPLTGQIGLERHAVRFCAGPWSGH